MNISWKFHCELCGRDYCINERSPITHAIAVELLKKQAAQGRLHACNADGDTGIARVLGFKVMPSEGFKEGVVG